MTVVERQLCDYVADREAGALPGHQESRLGKFFSYLFEAIAHADAENIAKLRGPYPEHVRLWNQRKAASDMWPRLRREYRSARGEL